MGLPWFVSERCPVDIRYSEREPLQDACGIVGILASNDAPLFELGLSALKKLQTRGFNGAGYTALRTNGTVLFHKQEGTIAEVFKNREIQKFKDIPFYNAQFQVRYGTSGDFSVDNVQPFITRHKESNDIFMVSHNGQFSKQIGPKVYGKSDTAEFVEKLVNSEGTNWEERLENVLPQKGAWSLIIGTRESMFLARDPLGVRPLYYAQRVDSGTGLQISVAASETIALTQLGFENYHEVLPGQIVRFDRNTKGYGTFWFGDASITAHCIFENVYIHDENSKALLPREVSEDVNTSPDVYEIRRRCGQILAKEAPLTPEEVDLVIGVPGTGIAGGEAYAQALGLPYLQAIRDKDTPPYEQRTFMQSEIDGILKKVMKHFNFNGEVLRGKRVVLVDDSIVRGNISSGLVRLLKEVYGVREVHFRVLCPPIDKRCYLGINTRSRNELIAAKYKSQAVDRKHLVELIRGEIGADSLAYLSDGGLLYANTGDYKARGFCMGCMVGNSYPIDEYGNPLQTDIVSDLILEEEIG